MVQELAVAESNPGLHPSRLSAWETLGQSLASVAPTASPAMVVPLVLMASGKASWFVYVLATLGIACIASQINRFAISTSSPGSLYAFVHEPLGRWPSVITGWALLIAYAGTAAAVVGGFTSYVFSLTGHAGIPSPVANSALGAIGVLLAGALAYRDVQLSARLMLYFEFSSIGLLLLLFLLPGRGSALHVDLDQLRLSGIDLKPVRDGLVLAIFSFVGFESAAALGAESRDPVRTIPRAIRFTAIASGLFFVLTAYAEARGFGAHISQLQNASSPLQLLASLRGMQWLSPLLAIGSVVSFFACTLACITAASRTAYAMSLDGYLHSAVGRTHSVNRTPHAAVVAITLAIGITTITLSARGVSPFDLYGWVGTIATYGFITAYFLVTIAALTRSVRAHKLTLITFLTVLGAFAVLGLAVWSAFDFSAPPPLRWLPSIYFSMLVLGVVLSIGQSRRLSLKGHCSCCR